MYRRNWRGKVCGVLTDFDRASWTVDLTKDYQKTGTRPFMAYGVLEGSNPYHLYRHDVESMFYIMVTLASRYEIRDPKGSEEGGVRILQEPWILPFDEWYDGSYDQTTFNRIAISKWRFLTRPGRDLRLSPDFEAFREWLQAIHGSFREGVMAKEAHEDLVEKLEQYQRRKKGGKKAKAVPQFDEETLGGHVNYSTLVDSASKLKGKLKGLVVRYRPR